MSIPGTAQRAAAGLRGFDIDSPVSSSALARQFVQAGYSYCLRYIPLARLLDPDLTAVEVGTILGAGLALMPVQHVLDPGWTPSATLGAQFGQNAVKYLQKIGFPQEVNAWCDLEGVGTPGQGVIDYCNAWYSAVAAGGYVPGLYVGYQPGLTDRELYDLPFQHYWAAYNTDSSVAPRGYQLVQAPQSTHVAGLSYDDDVTRTDMSGGTVVWLAPG